MLKKNISHALKAFSSVPGGSETFLWKLDQGSHPAPDQFICDSDKCKDVPSVHYIWNYSFLQAATDGGFVVSVNSNGDYIMRNPATVHITCLLDNVLALLK